MPLLSIIVPIYNVSAYLREGLDSILQQEVKDIEVICVDDCSSDQSSDILKKYQGQDNRILLISHSENRGPSVTRNTGLAQAKGEYVAFFDPDDKVERNLYSELIQAIEVNRTDMAFCGYTTFPTKQVKIPDFKANIAMKPADFIKGNRHILSNNDLCFTWRFLFKHSLLRKYNLQFIEEIRIGEDTVFNLACLMQASSVIMVPKALYQYRVNNTGSLMRIPYKPYLEDSLQQQILEKKRLIREYELDKLTSMTNDLSESIILYYLPLLFNNMRNNNHEDPKEGIRRILSLPMIRDAFRVVGFRNIFPSWKEYVFYLAMKFKKIGLVYRLYFGKL